MTQLSASHQTLTSRLTTVEIDLRNKRMAEDETEAEIRALKERQSQAEMSQISENKQKESLEAKMDLRRRQIERAMFLLQKREEMFQNDLEGREVVQTVLKAMTNDEFSNALCNVRDLEDTEVDRIIYRLSEVRNLVIRWLFHTTQGIFNRHSTVDSYLNEGSF